MLNEVSQRYLPLLDMRIRIEDINDLIVSSIAVQSNGAVKLSSDLDLETAKYKVNYSHAIAKLILTA